VPLFVLTPDDCRFGVKQRERLLQGLLAPPHMLLMSATPIPRTLALVKHGGVVLSTISSMPPGRRPVKTTVVADDDAEREKVSQNMKQQLATCSTK
jgi:ATP-dependent DNA helicase RecG